MKVTYLQLQDGDGRMAFEWSKGIAGRFYAVAVWSADSRAEGDANFMSLTRAAGRNLWDDEDVLPAMFKLHNIGMGPTDEGRPLCNSIRSMSVGDVVVIDYGDRTVRAYQCRNLEWMEIMDEREVESLVFIARRGVPAHGPVTLKGDE